MALERKTIERRCELRTSNDGTLSGYAAVFYDGSAQSEYRLGDWGVERIERTAFDAILGAEQLDVRALYNHDPNWVLGRTTAGTLRLEVDRVGLRYSIAPGSSRAHHDVLDAVRRGDVTGSSFGFTLAPDGDEIARDGDRQIRWLREVGMLFDVGPVTFPAYENSTAEAKSAPGSADLATALFRRSVVAKCAEIGESR